MSSYYTFNQTCESVVNWEKVRQDDIQSYKNLLNNSHVLNDVVFSSLCDINDIDELYELIVKTITTTSEKCFPKSKFKYYLKPYWNFDLSQSHKTMKSLRHKWVTEGRPRDSNISSYIQYKNAKCSFRKQHRYYAQQYLNKPYNDMDKFAEIDQEYFWKLVNNRRKHSNRRPGSVLKFNNIVYREKSYYTAMETVLSRFIYTML